LVQACLQPLSDLEFSAVRLPAFSPEIRLALELPTLSAKTAIVLTKVLEYSIQKLIPIMPTLINGTLKILENHLNWNFRIGCLVKVNVVFGKSEGFIHKTQVEQFSETENAIIG
jgi:hypothetical protein